MVEETILQIEANIDNMNPELYSYIIEELLNLGAQDAWLVPIIMKKGRPAVTLFVLCKESLFKIIERFLFTHTTTIGFRYFPVNRKVLERSFDTISYEGHIIHIKTSYYNEQCVNQTLEYEDLLTASKALNKPVKWLEKEIWAKYNLKNTIHCE